MEFVPVVSDAAVAYCNGAFDWFVSGDRPSTLTVMGYVLVGGRPVEGVRLYSEGVLLAAGPAYLPRPDAVARGHASEGADACGFHLRFSKFLYRPGRNAALMAVRETPDGNVETLVGYLRDLPPARVHSARDASVNPLMVISLGRSGSTLLMALLSQHPEISVLGSYPFEVRPVAWLLQTLRVQISPADHAKSLSPDAFEAVRPYTVGFNPYWSYDYERQRHGELLTDWLETRHVSNAIDALKGDLDDLAKPLADSTRPVRYLAEKFNLSGLRPLTFNVFPRAREIFLVRDFRDSFASARRFNAKRNNASFGREFVSNDREWIRAYGHSVRSIHQAWKLRPGTLVRYEDLVAEPERTCMELCRSLGVDHTAEVAVRMVEDVHRLGLTNADAHMTSPSASASIGSWAQDIAPEEQRLLLDEIGEALADFGYVA